MSFSGVGRMRSNGTLTRVKQLLIQREVSAQYRSQAVPASYSRYISYVYREVVRHVHRDKTNGTPIDENQNPSLIDRSKSTRYEYRGDGGPSCLKEQSHP